ncbi:MAG: nucleotidyltransferase domain-containing protein [Eubacteriales bacterium]|nr:nucleotidyltransferase domain-containing protein [Eubacteriales bacterium]
MGLSVWTERRELLLRFQKELLDKFPEEDYNVFVFGSFVRSDFREGQSDIDMIVYCNDTKKQYAIHEFCENFFEEQGLSSDVLNYYYIPDAYVYAVGILNSIKLTDFYPQRLKDELYLIARNYGFHRREQEVQRRYLNWDYLIGRKRAMERR